MKKLTMTPNKRKGTHMVFGDGNLLGEVDDGYLRTYLSDNPADVHPAQTAKDAEGAGIRLKAEAAARKEQHDKKHPESPMSYDQAFLTVASQPENSLLYKQFRSGFTFPNMSVTRKFRAD